MRWHSATSRHFNPNRGVSWLQSPYFCSFWAFPPSELSPDYTECSCSSHKNNKTSWIGQDNFFSGFLQRLVPRWLFFLHLRKLNCRNKQKDARSQNRPTRPFGYRVRGGLFLCPYILQLRPNIAIAIIRRSGQLKSLL